MDSTNPHGFHMRAHRYSALVSLVAAVACGGNTTEAQSADGDTGSVGSNDGGDAQACIERANGERESKADEPVRIGLSHVLVRHVDSKRAEGIKRSRGEACLRALEALKKLEASGEWAAVVAEYSDEKGAAGRKGSLGQLRRDDLDPAFADAAFELEVEQLSYVVETPAGFHVILRTD
jgi:hypothetical protein